MIMKKLFHILTLCLIGLSSAYAQQTMSLHDCVQYAIDHNIGIEQRKLQEQNAEIALETSRFSRLPSVSASLGQSFGFGRSTGRDGSTVDQTSTSSSFNIGAQVPVFTGFRISNQIKADRYSLKAATENLEKAKRDITVTVASYYLNALYYRGLTQIQRQQLALDRDALAKAEALFETGRQPESEVANARAQVAMSEHSLTEAEGNEMIARLDLIQALNLDCDADKFSVIELDTTSMLGDMPLPETVFAYAVETHPAIMAAKYNLEQSRYSEKVARSYMMPSLSLNASYSNSYYHLYDSDYNKSFGKQLKDNGSEYVGVSLSIPIFNRFSSRNSVRQARLSVQSYNWALEEARQTLGKEIQQAYWNAAKARDNYASAKKAAESTSIAYRYEAERFAAGRSTSYDLQQARTKLEKALHDEVQSKYEYLIRVKILEFYNGQDF